MLKSLPNQKIKLAVTALLFLLALVLYGQLSPTDGQVGLVELTKINLQPFSNSNHILGTDSLGHDVFLTACLGAKYSLSIGLLSALIAVSFGTAWGAISATSNRLVQSIMMRIVDALLSIPALILLLALTALINRPEFKSSLPEQWLNSLGVSQSSLGILPLVSIILVISSTCWLEAARIAYSKISSINLEEFIEASRSMGASKYWLLRHHLIPNARRIILIQTTLLISDAVVMEAGLSFLGLGLSPDMPSWGGMLRQAQTDLFYGNWWAPLVPTILISLTILSINLLGEGLLEKHGQEGMIH